MQLSAVSTFSDEKNSVREDFREDFISIKNWIFSQGLFWKREEDGIYLMYLCRVFVSVQIIHCGSSVLLVPEERSSLLFDFRPSSLRKEEVHLERISLSLPPVPWSSISLLSNDSLIFLLLPLLLLVLLATLSKHRDLWSPISEENLNKQYEWKNKCG